MKSILVVDDDVEFCSEIKGLLEKNGYNIAITSDGWKALDIARAGIDLVLFDLKLSSLSGHYFINILKTDKNTEKVPIFIISGYDDSENKRRGQIVGVVEYFVKPPDIEVLLEKIKAYLFAQ